MADNLLPDSNMIERTAVIVSRKFEKGAPITIVVSQVSINISTPLEDFLDELVLEVGNPAFIVTQTMLRSAVQGAASRVVTSMKAETAAVM